MKRHSHRIAYEIFNVRSTEFRRPFDSEVISNALAAGGANGRVLTQGVKPSYQTVVETFERKADDSVTWTLKLNSLRLAIAGAHERPNPESKKKGGGEVNFR